jgi:hypothetical protein
MTKWPIGVAVMIAGFLACGTTGPGDEPSRVTDRVELHNQPGGVGPRRTLIKICVSGGDGCGTYVPENVKNCHVGDPWPACRDQ